MRYKRELASWPSRFGVKSAKRNTVFSQARENVAVSDNFFTWKFLGVVGWFFSCFFERWRRILSCPGFSLARENTVIPMSHAHKNKRRQCRKEDQLVHHMGWELLARILHKNMTLITEMLLIACVNFSLVSNAGWHLISSVWHNGHWFQTTYATDSLIIDRETFTLELTTTLTPYATTRTSNDNSHIPHEIFCQIIIATREQHQSLICTYHACPHMFHSVCDPLPCRCSCTDLHTRQSHQSLQWSPHCPIVPQP